MARTLRGAARAEVAFRLAALYPPGPDARRTAAEAARIAPDSLKYLVADLRTWLDDPTNNAPVYRRRSFERSAAKHILELDPVHPLALQVLARWELDEATWNAQNERRFHTTFFRNRRDRAIEQTARYLKAWKSLDPTDPAPYREFVRLYVHTEDWDGLFDLAEAMRALTPRSVDALLYLGLAEHKRGNEREAAFAMNRALALMPFRERSLYTDARRFTTADEAGPGDAWSDAFWTSRDPRQLTPENERLTAHIARMTMADVLFGKGPDARGWNTLEGDLIVRYGLPSTPIATLGPYGATGERLEGTLKSWVIPSLQKAIVLESPNRNGSFDFWSPSVRSDNGQPNQYLVDDYSIVAKDLFYTIPENLELDLPGRRVRVPRTLAVLRGQGGKSRIVVAFGVPIAQEVDGERMGQISLDAGLFVNGPSGPVAAVRRPVVGLSSDGITRAGPERLWTCTLTTAAEPGRYRTSIEFEFSDRSALAFEHDSLDVKAFEEDTFSMSDLIVTTLVTESDGSPSASAFEASGFAVHMAPGNALDKRRPLYLFFELYGLSLDPSGSARFSVEAVLSKADRPSLLGRIGRLVFGGSDRNSVSVTFDGSGRKTDDAHYFILDTSTVDPGSYRITVRVSDEISGLTTENERVVELIESP